MFFFAPKRRGLAVEAWTRMHSIPGSILGPAMLRNRVTMLTVEFSNAAGLTPRVIPVSGRHALCG